MAWEFNERNYESDILNKRLDEQITLLERSIEVWSKVERKTKKDGSDFAYFKKAFPDCELASNYTNDAIHVDYDINPYNWNEVNTIYIDVPKEYRNYGHDYTSLNAMDKSDIEKQIKDNISHWQTELGKHKALRDNGTIEKVCDLVADDLKTLREHIDLLKDSALSGTITELLAKNKWFY